MTEERLAEFINLLEHTTLPLNETETQDETEKRPSIRDGPGHWYDNENWAQRPPSDTQPRPKGNRL